ncbi:MAG: MaoC family dehydratase [Gemmatimonadetes bacterium]|nr:MaoC family dehydratase [Gemmatimonadota bacterium]
MLQPAIANLASRIGQPIGSSDWYLIDQARIDAFAKVTDDPDPMHVDPDWCARESPFRTTIAFGFLTVSLLTHLSHQALGWLSSTGADDGGYALNYGFDYLRLIEPVPVNSRIRAHFGLREFAEVRPGEYRCCYDVTVEIEGRERPALVAHWLGMWVTGDGHRRIVAKHQ